MDIGTFSDAVHGINKRGIDRCHDVEEQGRSVSLDENESGQGPNASHQSKG
jgi:hypothetical protein